MLDGKGTYLMLVTLDIHIKVHLKISTSWVLQQRIKAPTEVVNLLLGLRMF